MSADLRARFEAWAVLPPHEYDLARVPEDSFKHAWPGKYVSPFTETAWYGWECSFQALHSTGDDARDAGVFDLFAHLDRQRNWSSETFGPGSRAAGVVDHIRKELVEIEADPGDLKEWIDVVILALDGAWRSGASPKDIVSALVAKQTKNEGRNWPDWRTADPSKAIQHDRAKDPEKIKCDRWSCKDGVVVGPYDHEMTCGKCNGTGFVDAAITGAQGHE
jgi:hypothetical protein